MRIKILSIALLLTFSFCCQDNNSESSFENNHKTKDTCKALRDSAYKLHLEYIKGDESVNLDTALSIIDLAINCDSDYFIAYYDRFHLLVTMKRHKEAQILINKLIKRDPNSPLLYEKKALLHKEIGETDSSNIFLDHSENLLIEIINNNKDSLTLLNSLVVFRSTYRGEEEGLKLVDSLLTIHPKNNSLLILKEVMLK